jgi:hypothetical protein
VPLCSTFILALQLEEQVDKTERRKRKDKKPKFYESKICITPMVVEITYRESWFYILTSGGIPNAGSLGYINSQHPRPAN